jgi:hypothetical protein
VNDRERRAGDVFRIAAEAGGDPADERRLACSERPFEQDDGPRLQPRAEIAPGGDRLRF